MFNVSANGKCFMIGKLTGESDTHNGWQKIGQHFKVGLYPRAVSA